MNLQKNARQNYYTQACFILKLSTQPGQFRAEQLELYWETTKDHHLCQFFMGAFRRCQQEDAVSVQFTVSSIPISRIF